jgi:uncharacterized membrane protein
MARIDEVKEEINYLKLWLGIMVVTTISLISWLVGNYESENSVKVISSMVAVILLSVSIIMIDKNIKERIKHLKEL